MRGYTNHSRAYDELIVWLIAIIACYVASAILLYSGATTISAIVALIATCTSIAWSVVAHAYLIFLGCNDEPPETHRFRRVPSL